MTKIMLTGGGTGGHIYPNLALIPELRRKDVKVVYAGGEGDTLERRLAEKHGLPYVGVPCVKFVRSLKPKAMGNNLTIPFRLASSVRKATEVLDKEQPDAVFSKGGFVSLPYVIAALKKDIPVICHESDLTMGVANKMSVKKGACALAANPHSDFGEFVGMPLREELFNTNRFKAREKLGISEREIVLLAVGGSSGATALNDLMYTYGQKLIRKYTVIHITGKGKGSEMKAPVSPKYITMEYSDDMASLYHACDLVISRAGATAVAEVSALRKRALFIPLPKGISRGDQLFNADLAEEYGAAVLLQEEGYEQQFLTKIEECLRSNPMRKIANDSNGKIVDFICAKMRRGEICKDKKLLPSGLQ